MDEMKLRLTRSVAARLDAAPRSAEKDELIEELSDNLYRRFLDMAGAGLDEEAAFERALDDLGDVDELLAYLGVEPASDVTIDRKEGQTRITAKDGQTITINSGSDAEAAQPEGGADGQGGAHYNYNYAPGPEPGSPQSDLDAILANVGEICRMAMDQAKDAVNQAADAVRRRTSVQRDKGHVKVHFNSRPEDAGAPEPPKTPEPPGSAEPPQPPTPPESPEPPKGWEFEAELNTDEGRFFAGGGPKERKDILYGFGYDKARGGFFAQWGEYQTGPRDEPQKGRGPYFSGADAHMQDNDDGTYSVAALRDLRGIEVFTGGGDVSIHMSEAPDAGVIIDGDVDDLEVTCSADGVLTIREGRTASSSFFSRRGFRSADVKLFLPCRLWESIAVTTGSGDVSIDREGLEVDRLSVRTANGDLDVRLRACGELRFKSGGGDLELEGSCASLTAETMSGDISLRGQVEDAVLRTASGDIALEGLAARLQASTMSGDVQVETSALPQAMELSSKSGDCEVRIPDAGPFSVRMKTVSGDMDCAFPMNYTNGVLVYGDGTGPAYSMVTVSGDVSLKRY